MQVRFLKLNTAKASCVQQKISKDWQKLKDLHNVTIFQHLIVG